jgi:hypothetical protein
MAELARCRGGGYGEQRHFYRDVLGLKELGAGDDWVHFDMGFPNILELLKRSEEPEYNRPRFQPGFAVREIEVVRDRLIAGGAEAISDVDGGPESQGYWCYPRPGRKRLRDQSAPRSRMEALASHAARSVMGPASSACGRSRVRHNGLRRPDLEETS